MPRPIGFQHIVEMPTKDGISSEARMLVQLAFSLVCLALGASGGYAAGLFRIGWWLGEDPDAIKARESLKSLEDLTSRVTGQVEEHARRVESAQQNLSAAQSEESDGELAIAQAAEALREANEQLQSELRKAKRELERQQNELQSRCREARTDGLTQLVNRRAFDEEMDSLAQRIASSGTDAALLLLDIDHFKKFNDTYGHQVGDRVLRHVADVVRSTLAGRDVVVARYGGEEFAVILSSGSPAIAARVAEELRAAIEAATLRQDGKSLSITLSIGVSQTTTGLDTEELIARADEALYASKKAGRNCGHYHDGDRCVLLCELLHKKSRPSGEQPKSVELMNEALAELEAALTGVAAQSPQSSPERRRHERRPYQRCHLVAPIINGRMPAPEMFERAQFFDLSTGGFGMLLSEPPAFKNFVVALDKADGTVYALAEVVRLRRCTVAGDQFAWEVGCRFMGKLQSVTDGGFATAMQRT